MGSIDIFKPLSTVLSSTFNKSQQHQKKKRQELNPGSQGAKRERYPLCYTAPFLLLYLGKKRNLWPIWSFIWLVSGRQEKVSWPLRIDVIAFGKTVIVTQQLIKCERDYRFKCAGVFASTKLRRCTIVQKREREGEISDARLKLWSLLIKLLDRFFHKFDSSCERHNVQFSLCFPISKSKQTNKNEQKRSKNNFSFQTTSWL